MPTQTKLRILTGNPPKKTAQKVSCICTYIARLCMHVHELNKCLRTQRPAAREFEGERVL